MGRCMPRSALHSIHMLNLTRSLLQPLCMQTLLSSFCFGTLMLKTNMDTSLDGGKLYLGVVFYSVMYHLLTGYYEMAILVPQLPVFFRQRASYFFPAWSFNVPPLMLRVIFSVVDCTVYSLLVYFSTGMDAHAGRFFIFYAYMLLLQQMASALFRMCVAIARNFDVSEALTGGYTCGPWQPCISVPTLFHQTLCATFVGTASSQLNLIE